jgi:hypothetical protein
MAFLALSFFACKDDSPDEVNYDYHAHVHSPNTADKSIGDTLHIDIDFESHAGEPVHHIRVRILEENTTTVLYEKPDDPHVGASASEYTFEDEVVLSIANGFQGDKNYVLEATVWGEEDGDGEEQETVVFHVHP